MLKSSLCGYSDTCIFVNNRINIIFKNCPPFTNYISEINNAQIDKTKDIDVVMIMYNLLEYSNNCSKTLGSL